ncbi:MAG: Calx-beta domain-containing protein [Chloroflexota bacterium]
MTHTALVTGYYYIQVNRFSGNNPNYDLELLVADPPPQVSFSSAAYDVDEDAGTINLTVQLDKPAIGGEMVQYDMADGTATAGADYVSNIGVLIFSLGATSHSIPISIIDDEDIENNESFTVTLSNPSGLQLGTVSETEVTIAVDEFPIVSFSQSSYSVAEDAGSVTFELDVEGETSWFDTDVWIFTSNESAEAGSDYVSYAEHELHISDGEPFEIEILNDSLSEGNETFWVSLAPQAELELGHPWQAEITIIDDDMLPQVSLSASSYSVDEDEDSVTITVELDQPASGDESVQYTTTFDTATPGPDYTHASGTVSFDAGEQSKSFTIDIVDDSVVESEESFTVTLSNAVNAELGNPKTAVVTIEDDDSCSDDAYEPNNDASAPAAITPGSYNDLYLCPADSDYFAFPVNAGQTIDVDLFFTHANGDIDLYLIAPDQSVAASSTSSDDNESVTYEALSSGTYVIGITPPGAETSNSYALELTLTDPPATPQVSFSAASYDVGEADGSVMITVALNEPASGDESVQYATSNGTATAGSDYTATSGTVSFGAGEQSHSFTVDISSDSDVENHETFMVTLSSPTNAALGEPSTATVTILDDDSACPNDGYEPNDSLAVAASITVGSYPNLVICSADVDYYSFSVAADQTIELNALFAHADGNLEMSLFDPTGGLLATANTTTDNETITHEAAASGTYTVLVVGYGDASNDYTLELALVDPAQVSFALASYSVAEDGGFAIVEVVLDRPASGGEMVEYGTSGGTAVSATDFTPTSGTLTFSAGQQSKSIMIPIIDDAAVEGEESFTVVLSNPVGAVLGSVVETAVFITDDDSEEPSDILIFLPIIRR